LGLRDLRLIVRPGAGLLVRKRESIFLLTEADDPATAELLAAVTSSVGTEVLEKVFDVVRHRRPDPVPPFCVLVDDGAEIQVAIHGRLTVEVDAVTGGQRQLAGTSATSRIEETLDGAPGWIGVGPRTGRLPGEEFLDLVEGVASAGAFELAGRSPEAAVQEPATVAFEPVATPAEPLTPAPVGPRDGHVPSAEATVIDKPPPTMSSPPPGPDLKLALTAAYQAMSTAPEHAAAPEVEGRLCEMGHLNNPASAGCWICASPVGSETAVGPRPPLGRITTIDKRSLIVDGDLVFGRRAELADAVKAGRARPIEVPPDQAGVSRAHAALELDGWSVRIRDLGSANGTYVFPPGETKWRRVDPAEPVELTAGTVVTLGGYELYFEGV
jgi:hypothetical protein